MTWAFRRMTEADLPLANGWIAGPEVARWWDEPVEADDLGEPDHRLWIAEREGAPVGFVQDYDPHAEPGHHFAHLPPGSRGLDLFLADPAGAPRGEGSALLRAFADKLMAEGAPAVGGDPSPDNPRAIRAAEKAGFVLTGGPLETPWGVVLLMEKHA